MDEIWKPSHEIVYRLMQLHLTTLLVLFLKEDLIRPLYKSMKLVSSVIVLEIAGILIFLSKHGNMLRKERSSMQECPIDSADAASCITNIYMEQRDIFLAMASLLAHALVIAICFHRDKFERYMEFRQAIDEDDKKDKWIQTEQNDTFVLFNQWIKSSKFLFLFLW